MNPEDSVAHASCAGSVDKNAWSCVCLIPKTILVECQPILGGLLSDKNLRLGGLEFLGLRRLKALHFEGSDR